jgi:hypothetical protein
MLLTEVNFAVSKTTYFSVAMARKEISPVFFGYELFVFTGK